MKSNNSAKQLHTAITLSDITHHQQPSVQQEGMINQKFQSHA
jgi:hypothetical protein